MKIRKAYDIAIEKTKIDFGRQGHYFTWVGWRSPSSGEKFGPYLVTISGDEAIEISRKGNLKDIFSADAKHYFPWIEEVNY